MRIAILDGYTDEPAGLGVPPYLGTYPRYIAGACSLAGASEIRYFTIDEIRRGNSSILERFDVVFFICGVHTPGKYLRARPASLSEMNRIASSLERPIKVLGGPAASPFGHGVEGGAKPEVRARREAEEIFDIVARGDVEAVAYDLVREFPRLESVDPERMRSIEELREFSIRGAFIARQHPDFPNFLIAEIETYRGCARAIVGGCSFCTEPRRYGLPEFRPINDVVDEIGALYDVGVRHFRIGRQACIFTYMARGVGELEHPKPNPEAIEELFEKIRRIAPELRTLHVDNANPGVIAEHPEESFRIARIIAELGTPGNVAAFGVESFDPVVVKKNNLKAYPEQVLEAVRIINEAGAERGWNGLPKFLPGINLVFGLIGERKRTYELNYLYLKEILDRGYMLRRINIRQVIPFPGTPMWRIGDRIIRKHREYARIYKMKIRREIDQPMLRRVVPVGTILRDLRTEVHEGNITYCRQIGTYPLLVGIPAKLPLDRFIDARVVDHGFRSITCIPYPLDLNNASLSLLESIPGIGRRRAAKILASRPIRSVEDLERALGNGELARRIADFCGLS